MIWLFTNALVWLFDIFVFVVVMSLFAEIVMPGKFETLHEIYRVILGFDIDEEEL